MVVFVVNVVVLSVTGLWFSAWLLYFTEHFPAFVAALSLGGVASWLGFVSKLLSDESKAKLKEAFNRHVLVSPAFLAAMVILNVIIVAALPGSRAGLVLSNGTDAEISIGISSLDLPLTVAAGDESRLTIPVGFLGSDTIDVDVAGLPQLTLDVGFGSRTGVDLPDDTWQQHFFFHAVPYPDHRSDFLAATYHLHIESAAAGGAWETLLDTRNSGGYDGRSYIVGPGLPQAAGEESSLVPPGASAAATALALPETMAPGSLVRFRILDSAGDEDCRQEHGLSETPNVQVVYLRHYPCE